VVRARPLLRRRRAADRACRARARWEAPLRPSLFSARVIARERLLEGRRVVRSLLPFAVLRAEAVPFGGGGSFTPARRAFDRPIAMACCGERAPCFPSRTW